MITIDGEEDVLVSQLSSFRYIEVGNEIHETLFQVFEIANVIIIPFCSEESKKFEFPMSSLKDAKTVIEAGHPEDWARVLKFSVNIEKFGLGYQSHQVAQ